MKTALPGPPGDFGRVPATYLAGPWRLCPGSAVLAPLRACAGISWAYPCAGMSTPACGRVMSRRTVTVTICGRHQTTADGIKRQRTVSNGNGLAQGPLQSSGVIMGMRCDMNRHSDEIEISMPTTVEAVHALVALMEDKSVPAEVRAEVAIMLLDAAGHRPYHGPRKRD